jgi:hypothetical protein
MIKSSFKISRRSFLLGFASILIVRNSVAKEAVRFSEKEIFLEPSTNGIAYKWILSKDDF